MDKKRKRRMSWDKKMKNPWNRMMMLEKSSTKEKWMRQRELKLLSEELEKRRSSRRLWQLNRRDRIERSRKRCARKWRSRGRRNKICKTYKRDSEKPSSSSKLFLEMGRVEQHALLLRQLISERSMTSQALASARARPS